MTAIPPINGRNTTNTNSNCFSPPTRFVLNSSNLKLRDRVRRSLEAIEHRNDRRLRPVRVLRSRGLRAGRKRPVHCTVRLRLETYLVELRDCYQIFSARESNILSSPARSVILFSVGSFNSNSGSCCILLSPFCCFLPSQSSIATRAHSIRLVSMRF